MEDQIDPKWRKAIYSGNGGSDCVEVGQSVDTVLIRDTKRRDGAELRFSPLAWQSFIASVKR
jgi:Domain of unknown function (DUF397)